MEKIICKKCGISKDATKDNFYWRNDSNSWKSVCRNCILLASKEKYRKEIDLFKQKSLEYRRRNHDKIIAMMTEYNSRPEVKARMRKYRINNRKKLRKKEKAWREKNPIRAKEIARRKRIKSYKNPLVRIRHNISRGINFALHRQGSSKAGESIMKKLEFSIEELRIHLEKLFEPWMSWNNYGPYNKNWDNNDVKTWTWQIDHIIPQSEFKYDSMDHPDFHKCWALENLRPYSARANSVDGSNRSRHKGNNAN